MTMLKCAMIGLAGLGVAALAAPASGQATLPSRQYHLRTGSLDQEGCFGACQCPGLFPHPMRGTFVLTPTPPDPLFQNYAVTSVHWRVPALARELTGSGTYRIGGEVAVQQQMTLQLAFNGEQPPRAYDSGLEAVGSPGFPVIHVHLHVPSAACWHTEFDVRATPFIGDWNGDGLIRVQDVFDYLNDWFAGDGDANEDGSTNLQDVFDFVNGWFSGD